MKFRAALSCAVAVFVLCPVFLQGQGAGGIYDRESPEPVYYGPENSGREDPADYLLSMPLRAYPETFQALSGYNFSFVRYLRRGYDYGTERITLNGADLEDRFSGGWYWNVLTAVNSSLNTKSLSDGLAVSETEFGAVGGVRTFDTRAGGFPDKLRVGWMNTNRRFRNGFRVEAASDWSSRNWAYAFSVTGRMGRDARIRGVYADNWTFSASAAKRFGDKHTLVLSLVGASLEQGVRGASTAEAFSLSGDLLYNPYWGDNNGSVYTSRVRSSFQPVATVNWNWKPAPKWEIATVVAGLWGENRYSSLGWYDAVNPYPDYYRNLPSFWGNPAVSDGIEEEWRSGNLRYTQIDWEELYRSNSSGADSPAKYVIGSDVTRSGNYQLASRFRYVRSPFFTLSGGVRVRAEKAERYRRLDNLLGAAYLSDVDQYLIDDQYFGDKLQNDVRHPGRRVTEGERYGYDYDLHHLSAGGWIVGEWVGKRESRLHGSAGVQAAQIAYFRDGHYEKELYPGRASYGRSPRVNFTDYLFKAGIGYRFTPAHSVSLNAAYGDRAPAAEDIFLSPDYRNRTVDGISPINLLSGELSYRFTRTSLALTLTAYATVLRNETQVYRYYDDMSAEYANGVLSGISKLHAGVELGLSVPLALRLDLRLAASLASYCYRNDPAVTIYSDKDGRTLAGNSRAYLKGYRLGTSPERVASGELRYSGTHYWTAALSVNYAGGRYVTLNPMRRMRRVCDYAASPEALDALLRQEPLGDACTLDFFLGKSFRIHSHFLSVGASVRNLLNSRSIVYSGYEQMRLRRTGTGIDRDIGPFGSKYYYAYPRTYYLTVNYSF